MSVIKVMGFIALAILLIVGIVYVICILIDTFDDVSGTIKKRWRKRSEIREEKEDARRRKADLNSEMKIYDGFKKGMILRKFTENPYDETTYLLVLSEMTNMRGVKYVETVECECNGDYDSGNRKSSSCVKDLYTDGYRVSCMKK